MLKPIFCIGRCSSRYVFLGLVVVASAFPRAASAYDDPLKPLVDEALKENLGFAQETLMERRAADEKRAAFGSFLPSVTLSSRYSHFDNVPNLGDIVNPAFDALNQLTGTSDFPTNLDFTYPPQHDSRVQVVQPIFNEGIRANYSVASGRLDGQRLERLAAARRLAADVQRAYLDVAASRRAVEIFDATLALVRENERVAVRLMDEGRATTEAVSRARAERSQVEQQLADARQRHAAAVRVLNQILHRPLDSPVEMVPDSLLNRPLPMDADSAVVYALAHREELRQADAALRVADATRHAATAGMLPSVSVALDYGFQGSDFSFESDSHYWSASVVASWNIFSGGSNLARRSAATQEAARARTLRAELEEKIELEVRTAHEAAQVAQEAIATADDRLAAARRTFDLVQYRYREGLAAPVELVDARNDLTQADINRLITAYRYAHQWVELERAAALRAISLEDSK